MVARAPSSASGSVRVYDDSHLVRCLYMLFNPVAAGLVSHPRLWPWSSYRVMSEHGCWARSRAVLGEIPAEADARFLALVHEGVERIQASRLSEGLETLLVAGELAQMQRRG